MLNPSTFNYKDINLTENSIKHLFNTKELLYLSDGFRSDQGVLYRYRYEEMKYEYKEDYLVIVINRKNIDDSFYDKEVIMPDRINELKLKSIVIHDGYGHYTSYLRNNDEWYYYNDMNRKIKYVGDYEYILSSKNKNTKPNNNGTIYFYN